LREAGAASVPSLRPVVDLLVETGLAKSKGDARRTISEGGAYLNNVRVEDPEAEPGAGDLIGGSWLVLRRGKKSFAGVEVG
jgi:tyrosyl-tRNA synthetase